MRNIDEYEYRDRNRENPSSDIKPERSSAAAIALPVARTE